jgi:CRP-like cAMP-binding protein
LSKPVKAAHNYILGKLSDDDYDRLRPHLHQVDLEPERVLFQPEQTSKYIYFPATALLSVLAVTPDGDCAEIGVVGSEGVATVCLALGDETALYQHVVQIAGTAWQVHRSVIQQEFARGGTLQRTVLDFVRLTLAQFGQTALCNRFHPVEQRLARWLLMCHDRASDPTLNVTQEVISTMLGASRVAVTQAASSLQDNGVIEYTRGRLKVLDEKRLAAVSCPCYRLIRAQYDSYLK